MASWVTGEALKQYLHGVPFLSFDGERAVINRLDPAYRSYPYDMWSTSLASAGVRLEFRTAAREALVRLRYVEIRGPGAPATALNGVRPASLPKAAPGAPGPVVARPGSVATSIWRDGKRISQYAPEGKLGDHEIKFTLPGGAGAYTVYLPFNAVVDVAGISADGLQPVTERRPRWLAFGDSITQGLHATDPGNTYLAIMARNLGLDLYNMGYSGAGRGEPSGAEVLAGLPADVITLFFGTNIMPRVWYDTKAWAETVRMFLEIVRTGHPTTPILVLTPLFRVAGDHETKPNRMGMTLPDLRAAQEAVVKAMQTAGDRNLHILSGISVIGEKDLALLEDGLHPNDAGMERVAKELGARLAALVKVAVR